MKWLMAVLLGYAFICIMCNIDWAWIFVGALMILLVSLVGSFILDDSIRSDD
jgi:hypothetical protein